jgi:hypothetical protein
MSAFIPPSFDTGQLELRYDDGEVVIYGTPEGLSRLSELCLKLARQSASKQTDHIHLEDYQFLTNASRPGVVGVFPIPHSQISN